MKWKTLKQNKWIRFLTNKYVLIFLLFVVWMVYFDSNSYFIHSELDSEIEGLEKNAEFYKKEIKQDREFMNKLHDSEEMERFAREEYYLKRENEDIFIVEHEDSIRIKEKK